MIRDVRLQSRVWSMIGLSADRQGYVFGRIPVKILRAPEPGSSDQFASSLDGRQLRLRCQVCLNHASSRDEAGSSRGEWGCCKRRKSN